MQRLDPRCGSISMRRLDALYMYTVFLIAVTILGKWKSGNEIIWSQRVWCRVDAVWPWPPSYLNRYMILPFSANCTLGFLWGGSGSGGGESSTLFFGCTFDYMERNITSEQCIGICQVQESVCHFWWTYKARAGLSEGKLLILSVNSSNQGPHWFDVKHCATRLSRWPINLNMFLCIWWKLGYSFTGRSESCTTIEWPWPLSTGWHRHFWYCGDPKPCLQIGVRGPLKSWVERNRDLQNRL